MPGLFDITAKDPVITLDQDQRGETSFTVTNISGRAWRARAIIVAESPEAQSWLSIEGQADRDFAVAGTQQYTVRVVAPSDASPGTYTFRLDMAREDVPDEDYTEGPSVAFEVKAVERKPAFPLWMIFVLVGVLVIVGSVIAYLVFRKPPQGSDSTTTATVTMAPTDTPAPPTDTPMPPTDTPTPPDLVITKISSPLRRLFGSRTFETNVTLSNQGGTAAGAFKVRGSFTFPGVPSSQTENVAGLGPGESITIPFGPIEYNKTGEYTATFRVDVDDQVDENNEFNNESSLQFRISLLELEVIIPTP
ncbi:MAG: hypothetical protein GTO18_11100 [Anaerolineales bacterium]|nr:hypothetical protein [Anaerolineales bacterium]